MKLRTANFTMSSGMPELPASSRCGCFGSPRFPGLAAKAGYEDWHLLENSTALDVLNGAAISQARQRPHDRIAAMAADGTAGLYGLRMGYVE